MLGVPAPARHKLYSIGFGNAEDHLDSLMQTQPGFEQKLQNLAMGDKFDPMRFQAEAPELHRAGALPIFAEAARTGHLNTVEDVKQALLKTLSPINEATGGATGVGDVIGKPALSPIPLI